MDADQPLVGFSLPGLVELGFWRCAALRTAASWRCCSKRLTRAWLVTMAMVWLSQE
jgi:hypothetical protein